MASFLIDSFVSRFRDQKNMAEKAIAQMSDAQLHQALDENTNSLAVIMKHMAGNLRSRFTDFLASDGEKPDRDRDGEFVDDISDRKSLLEFWEKGWNCLFQSLAMLKDDDLEKTVTIRSEPHTVIDALLRALAHQSYHVGQIVQLARYLARDNWQTLTIPKGGSRQFEETMRKKFSK